jgi:hypothetical protein
MDKTVSHSLGRSLTIMAVATMFAACSDQTSVAPKLAAPNTAQLDKSSGDGNDDDKGHDRGHDRDLQRDIETLRRVTDRYHNIEVAKRDSFVLLHSCETRLNDEPVGTVYVNMKRLTDGVINVEKPDALIYEPGPKGLKLVGVEFAIPFSLWTKPQPPKFHGATFQREDEFGVFALHAWVWRENPDGLFAEINPRVTCETP